VQIFGEASASNEPKEVVLRIAVWLWVTGGMGRWVYSRASMYLASINIFDDLYVSRLEEASL